MILPVKFTNRVYKWDWLFFLVCYLCWALLVGLLLLLLNKLSRFSCLRILWDFLFSLGNIVLWVFEKVTIWGRIHLLLNIAVFDNVFNFLWQSLIFLVSFRILLVFSPEIDHFLKFKNVSTLNHIKLEVIFFNIFIGV